MYCKKCYKMIDDGSTFCPHCGQNQQGKVKKETGTGRKVLGIILAVFGVFMIIGALGSSPTNDAPEMSAAEYKELCTQISYEDLARNPEARKGEYFTFTGEVIQVMESYGTVNLRINVTPVSIYDGMESYTDLYEDVYGETIASISYYQDTIFAIATLNDDGDRILEGDIIEFYGVCQGLYKYTSVLGAEIALPKIDIGYWEIVK